MVLQRTVLLLPFVVTLGMGQPATAQDGAAQDPPTGVVACDAFIAAYRRCVASPKIPASVRPSLQDGIVTLGKTFREAAGNEYARRSVAAQCVQAHDATRKSLVQSFGCDFPEADPALAQIAPTIPLDPARAAPPRASSQSAAQTRTPEQQEFAKANAYVAAHNFTIRYHPFAKDLANYLRSNERVLRLGTKLGDDAFFQFGINDVDDSIDRLRAAIALPGSVPGVDEAASRLLQALEALNPVLKALGRYQSTRAFRDDGFALARSQSPVFVERIKAADAAEDRFSDALSTREMQRDQARVSALPKDSLPRQLVSTSLALRQALRRLDAGETEAFATAMAEVSADNQALQGALDTLRPRPERSCVDYAKTVDSIIGYGRDIVRDLRAKSSPGNAAERFVSYYNNSIGELAGCQKDETRARL